MKTRLIENALSDLISIASIDADTRAWVEEMEGGFLIDAGSERDTLLMGADEVERAAIFQTAREEGALMLDESLSNLVFAFGRPRHAPDVLLHLLAGADGWLIRLAYCGLIEGFAFCPVSGCLLYDCSGVVTAQWSLGGPSKKAKEFTAFMLADYAISALLGLRKPKTGRQVSNRTLLIPRRLCLGFAA